MTLPLHLLAPEALAGRGVGDVVVLDGPEGRHAAAVRRTRVGEHLLLTDGEGLRVEGEVVAVGSGTLDLRVVSVARRARREGPAQVGCRAPGGHQAVAPHPPTRAGAHGHDGRHRRAGA